MIKYNLFANNSKTKYACIRRANKAGQYITLFDYFPSDYASEFRHSFDVIRLTELSIDSGGILTLEGKRQTKVSCFKYGSDGYTKLEYSIAEVAEKQGISVEELMNLNNTTERTIWDKRWYWFNKDTGRKETIFAYWTVFNGKETPITEVFSNFTLSDEYEILSWGEEVILKG